MLPWLVMMAAQLLTKKQQERQAYKDLYAGEVMKNANELGGNTREAELTNATSAIKQHGADYTSFLPLVGKLASGSDDEDDQKVQPRSGVKLKLSDFY